jgi:hypothetical protein
LTRLNSAGSDLVYSTLVGGNGNNLAQDMALDVSGSAYITGFTDSTTFPVKNPIQTSNAGGFDAFVIQFNGDGQSLIFST